MPPSDFCVLKMTLKNYIIEAEVIKQCNIAVTVNTKSICL